MKIKSVDGMSQMLKIKVGLSSKDLLKIFVLMILASELSHSGRSHNG